MKASKAIKKALDEARDHASQLPAGEPSRRPIAKLIGIIRRLTSDNPEIEQPIAPEPPDTGEGTPPTTTPPPTTKPV